MRDAELYGILNVIADSMGITEEMTRKPDRMAEELLDFMIEKGMLGSSDPYSGGLSIVALAQSLVAMISVTDTDPQQLSLLMTTMLHSTHRCPHTVENDHAVAMRGHMQKIALALEPSSGDKPT